MLSILLTIVFIRPFISSLAFPYADLIYTIVLFLFFAFWIIYKKGLSVTRIQALKHPFALLSIFLLISFAFSTNKLISLQEFYKYAGGIILFLIVQSLADKDKPPVARTILLVGLIISVIAIYQYFFGLRHTIEYMNKYKITDNFVLGTLQSKRIFFPFVTPNILAGYLCMIIPLALLYKDKLLFIFPIATAILLTGSVGALFSIFLGTIIYLYLQKRINGKKIAFLFMLLAVIGITFCLRSTTQKQHLQPMFSFYTRLDYWKEALKIILHHPLTGIGIGNFNLLQSRYAHNSYLQLGAEIGILGLIFFVWLIIKIIRDGLRNGTAYKNVFLFAITVFLFHNLFDFSFFLPEVSFIWWVILGLLL